MLVHVSRDCTPRPLLDTHSTIGNPSFKVPDYTLDILLTWQFAGVCHLVWHPLQ